MRVYTPTIQEILWTVQSFNRPVTTLEILNFIIGDKELSKDQKWYLNRKINVRLLKLNEQGYITKIFESDEPKPNQWCRPMWEAVKR